MLGRFHEISLTTADIRASVEFYERLGFRQAHTGDTWPHPYGVVTDGRIVLGLHESAARSAAVTFVRPDVDELSVALERRGIELAYRRLGTEVFNEIGLTDPAGQLLTVLEARTYSPLATRPDSVSLCGYFMQYSLPGEDFAAAKDFWEALGFVATEECAAPYPHLPLTSDYVDIAFHRPRTLARPALVFADADMPARIARLRELGMPLRTASPKKLGPGEHALLESPEGTLLLLLTDAA